MNNNLDSKICDVWNYIDNCFNSDQFDRYKVLCSYNNEECNDKEKEDYKSDLTKIIQNIVHLFYSAINDDIWLIINFYSLFLNARLNTIQNSSGNQSLEIIEDKISWFRVFGSVNNNIVLKIIKDTNWNDNTITYDKDKGLYTLKIPKNDIDVNYLTRFKEILTNSKIDENGDLSSSGNKLFQFTDETDNLIKQADITEYHQKLFSNHELPEWENCLIFINKYMVDFADGLTYFPNILFFKTTDSFTGDDVLLCKKLKDLYVRFGTKLLVFENDILLERLSDLVDSKPQRIFTENFSYISMKEDFVKKVENVFYNFLNNHLEETAFRGNRLYCKK